MKTDFKQDKQSTKYDSIKQKLSMAWNNVLMIISLNITLIPQV